MIAVSSFSDSGQIKVGIVTITGILFRGSKRFQPIRAVGDKLTVGFKLIIKFGQTENIIRGRGALCDLEGVEGINGFNAAEIALGIGWAPLLQPEPCKDLVRFKAFRQTFEHLQGGFTGFDLVTGFPQGLCQQHLKINPRR